MLIPPSVHNLHVNAELNTAHDVTN